MNKKDDALKLALEALEYVLKPPTEFDEDVCQQLHDNAIAAIREALADHTEQPLEMVAEQPAQQGCMRCNTPKKCALYGCSPLTWPAEQPAQDDPDLKDKDPELVEQHYKQVVDDVRKVFDAKRETLPAQDQGQSCYCPNCEALSKELAALKAQQQEIDELTAQRDFLADILTRTANALKGQPAELSLHSWHDLPEVAQQLKAAQQQEPVAWMKDCADFWEHYTYISEASQENYKAEAQMWVEKLRTSPPASKPLTDAQIGAVAADIWGSVLIAPQSYQAFARAIEAKLKENT